MIVPAFPTWTSPCGRATIHHGDCLDVMRSMPDGSVDAVVTDPPYGLAFMGKAWDHGVPGAAFWIEALRVAKPGAHLLAFGGTRTFHRLACAIEDAGWEIRDCLSWLYGSGFPKSHNGAWGGTALKPAWEPVVMARKPLIGTVAANHAAHGTGALNIDGCRIAGTKPVIRAIESDSRVHSTLHTKSGTGTGEMTTEGRWPANVALGHSPDCVVLGATPAIEAARRATGDRLLPHDKCGYECAPDCPVRLLDEQSGVSVSNDPGTTHVNDPYFGLKGERRNAGYEGDSGGASRFFYTAKASRSERNAGLDGFPEEMPDNAVDRAAARAGLEGRGRGRGSLSKPRANTHPTVKPVDLMRWLVRLVTPMGGTVLDPFLGSGTTLVAALQEGCKGVGIEREAPYVEIAKARVAHEAAQGRLFA